MVVEREELARLLEGLRAQSRDPRHGVFGPESMMWRVNRESLAFLGGGRAALLQLAHPYVAHAVDQHSHTKTDPLGRFVRTFDNVFQMVFGDLDAALASARRVHTYHGTVTGRIDEDVGPYPKGHAYAANTLPALIWVEATLIHTAVQVFELVMRPLSLWEKDAYYEDWKTFGLFFGIPKDAVPRDWHAFERYMDAMFAEGSELAVGRPAREVARYLLRAPTAALAPAMAWYRAMTAALLPERIREEYGLRAGLAERATFRASIEALRRAYPRLPSAVRFLPAYHDALRRIGEKAPTPLERAASSAWAAMARSNRKKARGSRSSPVA